MLVVVDTNILMKDWYLRDKKWDAASTAIGAGRVRLILPEVVRLEVIGGYRRHILEKVSQVRSVLRKSSSAAKRAAEGLLAVYQTEIDTYPNVLDERLAQLGFELLSPTGHSHIEIVERAVARQPPFNESGGGYRDTLIWLTALDELGDEPFNNLTLVSDDAIFTKQHETLRVELQSAIDGELTVLRSLSGLEFPGEYDDAEYDLSAIHVGTDDVEEAISEALTGINITRWSPPGPDYADVRRVLSVNVDASSVRVKKQYGDDIYDLSAHATAEVEADVLVINDGPDHEPEAWNMSARWKVDLIWYGRTERYRGRLSDAGVAEVLSIDDRVRKAP